MGLKDLFEKHPHWGAVEFCVKSLSEKGFIAYLAGGCVRDALLGISANDFDIATNATPDQVENLFEKSIAVGKQFGVIVVPFENCQIEIATFRHDSEYKDGRHPVSVEFANPEEDAKRRDFTVNGMFYDLQKNEVVDFVEGQKDLKDRILRVIGDPGKRFEEDRLRLMRAIRFCAQLDFKWDKSTRGEVINRFKDIQTVSIERIRDEIFKTLKTQNAFSGLQEFYNFKYFDVIAPNFMNFVKKLDFDALQFSENLRKTLKDHQRESDSFEKLVGLILVPFYLSLKGNQIKSFEPEFEKLLEKFKVSNQEKKFLIGLLRVLEELRKLNNEVDDELIFWLTKSNNLEIFHYCSSLTLVEESQGSRIREAVEGIFTTDYKVPEPLVTGDNLKDHGVPQGKQMGELLKKLYLKQLKNQSLSKSDLLKDL